MTDISSRLANLSPEQRRLLALKLKQKAAAADAAPAGGGERPSEFPASFAQRRMWLLDRMDPGSTAYSVPRVWRIPGPLDAAALERALDELVRRHETLRTHLEERDGELVQVVAAPAPFRLEVANLSALAIDEARAELERLAREDAAAPFALERGPLFRARLVRLAADEHALLWNLHHAVTDGWSTGILSRELVVLYEAFSRGQPSPLAPLPLQYGDHAARERERLSGDALQRLVGFWREALDGVPTRLELAADHPRPAVRTQRGASVEGFLPGGVAARVEALARSHDATPFMVYLAVYQLLLGRYARQDDVLVGTAVANRASPEVEGIVGFFVNTLVLRGELGGDPTFAELLGRVREATLGAFEHQALPFEKLVEELNPERSLSHAPLVQAVIVLHNQHGAGEGSAAGAADAPALRLETTTGAEEAARFDLTLDLAQGPAGVRARISYATDLLEASTVRRMLDHYGTLLESAVRAPDAPLSALSMLDDAELAARVAAGAATSTPEVEHTIPALFAERAARAPDAVALTFGAESVTYAELDARANRLAHHLRKRGARPDSLVGVMVERSVEMVAAILGILKAGAGYLPLDPAYPEDRLAYMLEDSGARIVVTSSDLADRLPGGVEIVRVDADAEAIAAEPSGPTGIGVFPDSLAYVIYTSGSTGRPKGVGVPHRGVVRLVRGTDFADLGPEQVFLQLAPVAFDASTLELWAPLLNGGRLVVAPPGRLSMREIASVVEETGITTLFLTTGLFMRMADEELEALGRPAQLLTGGEALSVPHARKVLEAHPGLRLVNAYGPTENTTLTTCHAVRPGDVERASIPIGAQIANTTAWVLDGAMRPCPVGVPGELYTGGAGVARGYLGRPGLTAAAFVPDPFSTAPGARLYRTGDLVRWVESAEARECGSAPDMAEAERTQALTHSRTAVLEFLGRVDQQVKLRGFRIEPGEIESALVDHPAVREAVVLVRGQAESARLVAWVVAAEEVDAAELRTHLLGRLPEHMVPSAFVLLDALPLMRSGKVDRRALPDPDAGDLAGAEYVAPRTPTEQALAAIWAELLGAERVGVHDSFFALGGHSLLATRVVSRLRGEVGVELPMRAFFEHHTLGALAGEVDRLLGAARELGPPLAADPRETDLPLSFAQERLWFIDRLDPGQAVYNMTFPVRMRGEIDVPALERALGEIVRRHATLRTRFALVDGVPVQRIEPAAHLPLPADDLSSLPEAEREEELVRRVSVAAGTPFDLEAGPLFRARLFRMGAEDHALLVQMHHVVSDGWSMGIFWSELFTLYDAFRQGRPSPLPDLPLRYADFAAWQREWLRGERLDAQAAWWRGHLAGAPAVLELPADRPRPPVRSDRGGALPFALPAEVAEAVRALARREGATPFMVLLAAWSLFLSRASGEEDVVVGTPVAGRTRAETEAMIGFFVNTLPIRTDLSGDPAFTALLARVREATLGAFAHQDLPFERLVEELQPERSLSHTPLFQVMLVFQNTPEGEAAAGEQSDLQLGGVRREGVVARVDLTMTLGDLPDGRMAGLLEYAADLFDEETAARLVNQFATLLDAAARAPETAVSAIRMTDEAELAALAAWNDTPRDFGPAEGIHAAVSRAAARSPETVALAWDEGRMTYAEMEAAINRLARHLGSLGVAPGARVGVALERGPDLVVSLLAVMKAGAAYVPLDPGYPAERLAYMVEDSGASVVITATALLDRLPGGGARMLTVDGDAAAIAAESSAAPEVADDPDREAYAIYTSGSTGRPKGAANAHRGVMNRLRWMLEKYGITPDDVFLQKTTFSFDVSVWEFFTPLMAGGRLVLARPGGHSDPAYLAGVIAREKVTTLHFVPSMLSVFLDGAPEGTFDGVRQVMCSGEALPVELVERFYARAPEGTRMHNLYGPTEAGIEVTYWPCERGDGRRVIPIGRPVANTQIHVLDPRGNPSPIGFPGELFIAGAQVALGYVGRSGLTAEKFVPDPFSPVPGARMYRTGDRARWTAEGVVEYLGRLDFQVKVRGLRIELGEVEDALRRHAGVRDAVVLARGEGEDRRLVAWVVSDAGPAELRAHLLAHLPEYMVPSVFVLLDALPLTQSGKVDRRALPDPDAGDLAGAEYVAPRTLTEQALAALWTELLGAERVGATDGFFALGGHSLLATRLTARIRADLAVELPVRAVFEHTTLGALASEIDRLQGTEIGIADAPPILPAGDGDLPLSFAQERLWFIDRLEPGSAVYNMTFSVRMRGEIDAPALERALGEMVRRHASLRTRFPEVSGQPVQRIDPAGDFHLPTDDLSSIDEAEREEELVRRVADAGRAAFDLEAGPLFLARLLHLEAEDHVLLVQMHHAITDGWSMGIFWGELFALYDAFRHGHPSPLPEPALRYADFAAWQRRWFTGERLAAQVAWWREHLAGAPAVLELPSDRPRPATRSQRGGAVRFALPAQSAEAARELARREGATPFMVLLAAWSLFLSRASGQDDVVVGTPVAGRTRAETEAMIGFFVNTLPIRTDLSGDPTFLALLARVREATLGAYAHQDLPFERLVEELQPERSLSHTPLFQVMLTFQNTPDGSAEGEPSGLALGGVRREDTVARVDLTLVLSDMPDGRMSGMLEYATDLFEEATAERLVSRFATLLDAAARAPETAVSALPVMDDAERAAVVAAGSATATYEVAHAIPAMFAEQAARTPDAAALTFGGESVTYAELDARANRLAHHLVKRGAGKDSLVGLLVDRSIETVVGILGIVKAGAGYLPLDPVYPDDRLAYMLEDSGAPIVVTTSDLAGRLPAEGIEIVRVDADAEAIAAESSDAPSIDISPESLAYVIYTSGSTGKPKGVQVTHANVVRLFAATDHWFGFGAEDVWTLFHSYAFDFSVWEIWGALLYGGRLVVVPFEVSRSPEEFYALLETERVTVLNQTPSAFRQLMRADEEAAARGEMRDLALRHVVFGGEALDPATLRGWVDRRGDDRPLLVNMYGITETTVHVTYRVIREADVRGGSSSPIGIPIPDLSVHLLDRNGRVVPTGVTGEMYVGGGGVARGYLNRPELTAQRFVADPFVDDPDARLYRSGDLARRVADGSLEFMGRADDQVKVRGFRIELGEIESVLLDHPQVREAVVLTRGEGEAKRLVAWIVAAGGATAAELRTHLLAHLPEYMVPSAFVLLDSLPLTRNGKVDRRALPEPESGDLAGAEYVAPRTPTEEVLAAIWAQLLGAERVGATDGFFELGGHSLLATRLASRVRSDLGVELPVRAVFEHSTLGALAAEVDRLRRTAQGVEAPPIVPVPRDGDLPLSFAQERLWFVDRMEAGSATYHMPIFVRMEGALDEEALRRALDELVRRHESLRTFFPLVDGIPVQRVGPPAPAEVTFHDLSALRDDVREDEAERLVREQARVPFWLETGPLFRADLARLGEADHLLLITLHHVIADGWSLDVLWHELAALYGAFSRGEASPLPEPRVQYGDFAVWQRAWLRGEVLERQLDYWRRTLEGAPALLELPADRPRPEVQTHRGAVERAVLPREAADAVLALARKEGSTLFMVLLAAMDLVFSRQSGQDEVVVGTPIAGRTRAETDRVVGLFLNSLALRVSLAGDPAFREVLRRVRETTLDAYAHQDVPFEAVLEEIHPERVLDRTPVFQVMLNLSNFAGAGAGEVDAGAAAEAASAFPGLRLSGVDRGGEVQGAKFDLTLYVGEGAGGIGLQLVYNPDLFDAERMSAFLAQLVSVLEQAVEDPDRPVGRFVLADGRAPAGADRALRTAAGLPAGVGEPAEVWERRNGEWTATGQRGRYRPDGSIEPLVEAKPSAPKPAAQAKSAAVPSGEG
ncbi:MAG TPA: amino acid adenylation domain-containing protein, partial [Longimicrobium sp.]|nr:amino acid adenylation domain-containing protein [Longimicrobium sp.]